MAKTPKPPLDASLWAEAEKAADDWFAKAETELDRSCRASGKQPPPPAEAAKIIADTTLKIALVRVTYLSRLHARDVTALHERLAKLERQAKGNPR